MFLTRDSKRRRSNRAPLRSFSPFRRLLAETLEGRMLLDSAGLSMPTLTSSPAGAMVLGSGAVLSDAAILAGGNNPGGTITFSLYAPSDTGFSNPVYTTTVPVSGNGTYSINSTGSGNPGGFIPRAIGTYQWVASYSGDPNNGSVSSNPGDEPEVVVSPPAISTFEGGTIHLGSGGKLFDAAELIGGMNPTGTITFYLFAPGVTPDSTDSNNIYTNTVTIAGDGTYDITAGTNPGGYLPTAAGTYQWVALYSGDANNPPAASEFGDEPEEVVPPPTTPTITTTPGGSVALGSINKLTDTAALADGNSPTGTITFYLFAPGVTPNADDSNHVYTDTVTVSGNGSYDITSGDNPGGYLPTVAGTYQWIAVYSGDATNRSVASSFGDEPEIVTSSVPPVTPAISTTPGMSVVLGSGSPLTDSATLSGGTSPTGTITFYLFAPGVTPNATDSNNVYTDTVTVSGNGSYDVTSGTNPGGYLPTVAGTYQWIAVYSGDATNRSVASSFGDEPQVVTSGPPSVTPSITTTPGDSVVLGSGSKLTDSATLSGGTSPTSTITFYLFAPGTTPNATDSNNVYTDTVTVSGNGSYDVTSGTNPGGYLPTVAGTYQWVAVYSGDANNQSVSSAFGQEPETVVSSPPPNTQVVVFKIADQPSIDAGQTAGFDIKIQNVGANAAAGLTLSDALPGGVAGDINWQIDASGTGLAAGTEPADFVIFGTLGHQTLSLAPGVTTLAAGATLTVHITGQTSLNDVDPNLPPCTTTLVNTATVNAVNEPDNEHNQQATAAITLHNVDVDVSKTPDQTTIIAGQQVGFTIQIYNQGCITATGLTLNDLLPQGPGNDIFWRLDPTRGSPEFFQLTGQIGNQQLSLAPGVTTLQANGLISVHLIGQTTIYDVGTLSNKATVNANNEPSFEDIAQVTAQIAVLQNSQPNSNSLYVSAAFENVLGREPDQAALNLFANALSNGSLSRAAFAYTLTHSDEYYDIVVRRAYQHFLDRAPDSAGLQFWQQQLAAGLTDQGLESLLIASPEYYQRSGGTNAGWVEQMYFDLLGRTPDAQGEAYWAAVLAAGGSRATVALDFTASAEREADAIKEDYQIYLGRVPRPDEAANWAANDLQLTNEDIIATFIASDEYFRVHA